MIVLALWRRGLFRRLDREKWRHFVGTVPDPLALSRRYPMWRILPWARLLLSPTYAAAAARWLEYRTNLYDGVEG
ncbi:MAG TPA: hypothetical protein VJ826_09800 [Candidatus Polarisedimenticolaceae bacterium]|nr:hypothetical protein [Candidatus Polarisedimenticolaceae bacterium]